MPIGTPRPSEIETDTTPARIEARAPQMTRESTSRPSSSEPKRCARLAAPLAPPCCQGMVRRDPRCRERDQNEERHDRQPEKRPDTVAQASPGSGGPAFFSCLENDGGHQCLIRGLTMKYARSARRLSAR